MNQGTFDSYMKRVKFLSSVDYAAGYQRGLRRHFHGEAFGTEAEHEQWLALQHDETRAELARGYRDGFAGIEPEVQP
jgi:hypothetical protein